MHCDYQFISDTVAILKREHLPAALCRASFISLDKSPAFFAWTVSLGFHFSLWFKQYIYILILRKIKMMVGNVLIWYYWQFRNNSYFFWAISVCRVFSHACSFWFSPSLSAAELPTTWHPLGIIYFPTDRLCRFSLKLNVFEMLLACQ